MSVPAFQRVTLKSLGRTSRSLRHSKGRSGFVPDSWKAPRGDAVAAGALMDVEGVGGAARLRVRTAQGEITLEVRDPSRVELQGGGEARRVFSCGPQEGARVEIEYVTAAKAVVAIRFLP